MGNLNLLNWCQSTRPSSFKNDCKKKQASVVKLTCLGFLRAVQIDLTSALIFGCQASGKLRELSRALGLFCPAKSRGAHRLRHSPPQ
ncbi:hypothetical protein N7501_011505 [Penicillium viridicatum]|nr:hypothetical protein N7501_011505 [Penicillium viridicatum]